jgi:hypothetical protein
MRKFKTLLILVLVTVSGTFVSYKLIKIAAADPLLDQSKFGDVFTGFRPRYKKGATLGDKAAVNWKAALINQSVEEIVPFVLIAMFIFLCLGVVAAFKVYSGAWWR